MASRILGMGDVVSLVEQVHRQVDHEEAQRLAQKVVKGKGFDMADLKSQLEQLQKMGGVSALMDKLPGAATRKAPSPEQGDRELRRQIAIINSMTPPRAAQPRHHRRLAPPPHRRGLGRAGAGRQPPAEAIHGDAAVMKSMKGGKLRAAAGGPQGADAPGLSRALSRALRGSAPGGPKNWRRIHRLRRIRALFWARPIPWRGPPGMRAKRSW